MMESDKPDAVHASNRSPRLESFIFLMIFQVYFTPVFLSTNRMEKVALKSRSSQAKIVGTVVSMTGAFVVTLYQGPPIIFSPKPSVSLKQLLHSSPSNWTLGGILLIGEYILVTLWYIVQVLDRDLIRTF